jgi:hypothetical protein
VEDLIVERLGQPEPGSCNQVIDYWSDLCQQSGAFWLKKYAQKTEEVLLTTIMCGRASAMSPVIATVRPDGNYHSGPGEADVAVRDLTFGGEVYGSMP